MPNCPPFSVVIPFHGRISRVQGLLDDLNLQTYRNFNVILVDDGTPGELKFPEFLLAKDVPVTLIRLSSKEGAARARNVGAAESTADYLAFLDSDDYFDRNKLVLMQAAITANMDCAVFYGPYKIVDEHRNVMKIVEPVSEDILKKALLSGTEIGGCSAPVVSGAAFRNVGGFDDKQPHVRIGICG